MQTPPNKQDAEQDIENKRLEIARAIYRIFKDDIVEIYDEKNNKVLYRRPPEQAKKQS